MLPIIYEDTSKESQAEDCTITEEMKSIHSNEEEELNESRAKHDVKDAYQSSNVVAEDVNTVEEIDDAKDSLAIQSCNRLFYNKDKCATEILKMFKNHVICKVKQENVEIEQCSKCQKKLGNAFLPQKNVGLLAEIGTFPRCASGSILRGNAEFNRSARIEPLKDIKDIKDMKRSNSLNIMKNHDIIAYTKKNLHGKRSETKEEYNHHGSIIEMEEMMNPIDIVRDGSTIHGNIFIENDSKIEANTIINSESTIRAICKDNPDPSMESSFEIVESEWRNSKESCSSAHENEIIIAIDNKTLIHLPLAPYCIESAGKESENSFQYTNCDSILENEFNLDEDASKILKYDYEKNQMNQTTTLQCDESFTNDQETRESNIDDDSSSNRSNKKFAHYLNINFSTVEMIRRSLVGLNPEQEIILHDPSPHIYVNASPGTGKTFLLVKKALKSLCDLYNTSTPLSTKYTYPFVILTFSRNATNELRERISPYSYWLSKSIHTYHGFLLKYLLKSNSSITRDHELVTDAKQYKGLSMSLIQRIKYWKEQCVLSCKSEADFLAWKDVLEDPKMASQNIKNHPNSQLFSRQMHDEEFESFEISEGISFTDILLHTYIHMKLYPEMVPSVKYLLVDEFQDTSKILLEIIKCFNVENSFCVGDCKQLIYAWRGACETNIMEYKKYFQAQEFEITRNYRSNSELVACANRIINSGMIGLRKASSHPLYISSFQEDSYEIVARIASKYISNGKSCAILCSTNYDVSQMRYYLSQYANELPTIMTSQDSTTSEEYYNNTLIKRNEDPNYYSNSKYIAMTVHKAKGKEFDVVLFITSLKYAWGPDINEAKRVFYVGVTRAKETLILFMKDNENELFSEMQPYAKKLPLEEYIDQTSDKDCIRNEVNIPNTISCTSPSLHDESSIICKYWTFMSTKQMNSKASNVIPLKNYKKRINPSDKPSLSLFTSARQEYMSRLSQTKVEELSPSTSNSVIPSASVEVSDNCSKFFEQKDDVVIDSEYLNESQTQIDSPLKMIPHSKMRNDEFSSECNSRLDSDFYLPELKRRRLSTNSE